MIRNLKEINAYTEFRTANGINQVRTAVQTNTLPAGLTQLQSNKFIQRFLTGDFIVENVPATLLGNQAYGNPRQQRSKLSNHHYICECWRPNIRTNEVWCSSVSTK